MGWASGSYLANDVWKLLRKYVPDNKRKEVAESLLSMFEGHDADDFCSNDQLVVDADRGDW